MAYIWEYPPGNGRVSSGFETIRWIHRNIAKFPLGKISCGMFLCESVIFCPLCNTSVAGTRDAGKKKRLSHFLFPEKFEVSSGFRARSTPFSLSLQDFCLTARVSKYKQASPSYYTAPNSQIFFRKPLARDLVRNPNCPRSLFFKF